MKPKVGMAVAFNPHGTDERWYGEITAVHNDSTVNAKFITEDEQEIDKPDIHFCAPGEACEVSMCQALPKTQKGKPTVDEIIDVAQEAVEDAIEHLLDEPEEPTNGK